ncbi:hypothetical protein ACFQZI_14770 [Mucilaginibacter lutimaris]|uniref:Lipoprotein n=1 Tax=Mucilaginibacter lutimaris TaxID=931629 RepID=A0ABW2ZIR4_9SPHI
MKKYGLLFIIIGTLFSCINSKSKRNYKYTLKRVNNLYIEVYKAGLIGNLTSQYLTDSTNFRVHLGTFDDENGYIYCKIDGDNIYIEKREHGQGSSPQFDTLKVVSKTRYSLKDLKKKHLFE